MPLTVPSLDDRNYPQILREALARIPVHNPEWTNFNDSDPGVTLVQLMAFMTESLLYRANQIPERNRRKYLTLLGIPLRPAEPARGLVTIQNERGPQAVQTLDTDLDVRAGALKFRTTQGLQVLPIEARVFYKRILEADELSAEEQATYQLLYADLIDQPGSALSFYASTPLPAPAPGAALPVVDVVGDTVDRCLWIALLARQNEDPATVRGIIAGQVLTVGVVPAVSATGVVIPAGQEAPETSEARVVWEVAQPQPLSANQSERTATYQHVDSRASDNILRTPGLVELALPADLGAGVWPDLEPNEEGIADFPPSLADTDIQDRVITWLRLRIPSETEGGTPPQALISWLGINAATVVQRAQISGEVVGEGTGEPDQRLTLANAPVIPESLQLTVGDELWQPIDDLLAAAPEVPVEDPRRPIYVLDTTLGTPTPPVEQVKVYQLDPEAGTLTFGDGAHGMRPQRGQRIVASYAFGGGRAGNVGIGAIKSSPQLPAGFKINNPLPTWGGANQEDVATAEKGIPRAVQHRDRLVSVQDFKDITWRTPGVDLGRVEVIPLYDPVEKLASVPGVITLVVIPRYDPLQPDAPLPDQLFLDTICRYLQPRRLVTTELYIRGPEYKNIWISVGIQVINGVGSGPVIEAVKDELRFFLSPLTGGYTATGWPLETAVLQRELEAVIARVDGVRLVEAVLLGGATGGSVAQIGISGLELPRLVGVEVALDQPVPLDELRSFTGPQTTSQVPIPVIPSSC